MKLIDKDALVAELEKSKAEALQKKSQCKRHGLEKIMHQISAYNKVLSILNTLEVEDVDLEHLEQEVKDFCYEYDDRKEKWYELCPNDKKLLYNPTWANFAMSIAKHFFELGVNASNPLTWEDIDVIERFINQVHYEYPNGIGAKGFGEEVLERFKEYKIK